MKRYKDKLERIERRDKEISEWKEFALEREKEKLATYKAFEEVVEASMDLVAMIVRDIKKIPQDDYSNIERLEEEGMIEKGIGEGLKEANGLRNRIVHEYNGLDERIALDSMEKILPKIEKFSDVVKGWLKKQI